MTTPRKDHTRPFISVLTPTYNRRAFIPMAIACYKEQTYPLDRREWIILDDGTDSVEDLFTGPLVKGIPNLRYIRVPEGTPKLKVGAKRNWLNREATGEFCVAMDDDDYYFPKRIADIVYRFNGSPSYQLLGSSEMYFYFHKWKKVYRFNALHKNHASNGTLAYRTSYGKSHLYDESVTHAEEPSFLENYKNPMIQQDPKKCIVVMCHPSNTYDKHQMVENKNPHMVETAFKLKDLITEKHIREGFLALMEGQFPGSVPVPAVPAAPALESMD